MRETYTLSTKREDKIIIFILLIFLCGSLIGINTTSNYQADESYYIFSAMKMNIAGNWLVPYYEDGNPRFQKPILFYWMVAFIYKILGVGIWQARVVSLFFGILNLILIYKFSLLLFNSRKISIFSLIILASNIMFCIYSKAAVTDMALLYFLNLSIYFFYKSITDGKKKNLVLGYLFSGLAVATKGPVGFLIPFLTIIIYCFCINGIKGVKEIFSIKGILIFLLISLFWPVYMYIKFNGIFLNHFFNIEVKRRISFSLENQIENLIFYLHTTLRYAHIWIILFLIMIFKKREKVVFYKKENKTLLLIWIVVIFVLFSFFIRMHRSRYILPLFFPLSIIIAIYMEKMKTKSIYTTGLLFFLLFVLINGVITPVLKPEAMKKLCKFIKRKDREIITIGVNQRSRVWVRLFTKKDIFKVYTDAVNLDDFKNQKFYLIIRKDLWKKIPFNNKIGVIEARSSYNFKNRLKFKYFLKSLITGIKKKKIANEIKSLINKHKEEYLLIKGG